MNEPQGCLWTVYITYFEPTCGCRSCTLHERKRKVTTVSARGVNEWAAMQRGEKIADGKGYGASLATHAIRMGGGT